MPDTEPVEITKNNHADHLLSGQWVSDQRKVPRTIWPGFWDFHSLL